jgi:hypothetical protein
MGRAWPWWLLFLSHMSGIGAGTRNPPCYKVIGPALRSPKPSNCRTEVAADATSNVTDMQRNGRANEWRAADAAWNTRRFDGPPEVPCKLILWYWPCPFLPMISILGRRYLDYTRRIIVSLHPVTSAALDSIEAASAASLSSPTSTAPPITVGDCWETSQPQRSHACTNWHHRSVRPGCGTDTRFILVAVLACMIRSY